MPQIVYHGSSLAHPLQGLSDAVQGLAEGRMERERLDAILDESAQRLLLARSQDARAQEDQEWQRTQRPIEASQRDAMFRLREAEGKQRVEQGQIELDAYKAGQGANYDQAVLDDYDAYVANQLHGLEAEDIDTAALQALQAKVKTRRGLIENAGMGMLDPRQRAAAKAYIARMMQGPLQDEVTPLVREQTRRSIQRIGSRGHLSASGKAQAELDEMLARLDTPGQDPRLLRSRLSELQRSVADDLAYQGEVEAARASVGALQGAFTGDEQQSELARLDAELQAGILTPRQFTHEARRLAVQGSLSPEEQAFGILGKLNIELTDENRDSWFDWALQRVNAPSERKRATQAARPGAYDSLMQRRMGIGPNSSAPFALPNDSIIGQGAARPAAPSAAPTQEMAAQGAQAGGPGQDLKAQVRELMAKGDIDAAKRLVGSNDPNAPRVGNPAFSASSQDAMSDALDASDTERVRSMSDEELSEGSVFLDPKVRAAADESGEHGAKAAREARLATAPKGAKTPANYNLKTKMVPSRPAEKPKGEFQIAKDYASNMKEVEGAVANLKKWIKRRDAKRGSIDDPLFAGPSKYAQEDVDKARAKLDQIVAAHRKAHGGRLRVDIEDLLKSIEGLR